MKYAIIPIIVPIITIKIIGSDTIKFFIIIITKDIKNDEITIECFTKKRLSDSNGLKQ